MGKTSLAMNIAENVAKNEEGCVAVFSLEMSSKQLVERLITSESKIDSHLVRTGKLPKHEWKKLSIEESKYASQRRIEKEAKNLIESFLPTYFKIIIKKCASIVPTIDQIE